MIPSKQNERDRRNDRMAGIIAREAAQFIAREAGIESLITVTSAQSVAHGDRVMVFVSVFPEEKSRSALAFLERQREAFSDYLKTRAHLSPLPRVDFMLDTREEAELLPTKID